MSPSQRMPGNRAARALMPVSAPNTASPAALLARACNAADPETATTTSFTISVVWWLPEICERTEVTFQTPVRTSTANADQATWPYRRAAARGIRAPGRRSTGTSAASAICPAARTVAARTGRKAGPCSR